MVEFFLFLLFLLCNLKIILFQSHLFCIDNKRLDTACGCSVLSAEGSHTWVPFTWKGLGQAWAHHRDPSSRRGRTAKLGSIRDRKGCEKDDFR